MKYELTDTIMMESLGATLHRIKALRDIPQHNVEAGDIGGWIESEDNLSQDNEAWVGDEAQVHGNARVYGDAIVYGQAMVWGNAHISDKARVNGRAQVLDNTQVFGESWVVDNASVRGNAVVSVGAVVYGNAWLGEDAYIEGGNDIFSLPHVKAINSPLTAYVNKAGEIKIIHGPFNNRTSTMDEFEKEFVTEEVEKNRHTEELAALITYLRLHFRR